MMIESAGLWLVITTRLGVRLMWDHKTRVQVAARPLLKGHLHGLCGAFTGRSVNFATHNAHWLEETNRRFYH